MFLREAPWLISLCSQWIYLSKNADFTEWENVSSGFIGDDFNPAKPLNASEVCQDFKTGL